MSMCICYETDPEIYQGNRKHCVEKQYIYIFKEFLQ